MFIQTEVENRSPYGTTADFSNWDLTNKYGNRKKITTTERVIDPTEQTQVVDQNDTKGIEIAEPLGSKIKVDNSNVSPLEEDMEESVEEKKRPLPKTLNININSLKEIKELAKNLLPSAGEIKQSDYPTACNLAIDFAMTFEAIWEEKFNLGE